MLEITWFDILIYLLLASYAMLSSSGLAAFVNFVSVNAPFMFVKLPYKILMNRFLKTFEMSDIFNKRASDYEYIASVILRHVLKRFEGKTVESVFFGDQLNRLFYFYRVYTQSFNALGDTTYTIENTEGHKGVWIYSKSGGIENDIDLILFYFQGSAFNSCSPFLYMEFMQRFVVVLQEQGFKNPVVFMPKVVSDKEELFPDSLLTAYKTWSFVCNRHPESKIIVSGDSTGGTSAAALLLLLSQQSGFADAVGTTITETRKPDAALLISPITRFNIALEKVGSSPIENNDYLSANLIRTWGERYLPLATINSNDMPLKYLGSPGLCLDRSIWSKAFPKYGMVISYGSEEILVPEIESFISNLKGIGKLKVDKHNAQIHNWPILTYTFERGVDDREESINLFAGIISRMLLWETETYFEIGAKEPTQIITIDDNFV